jgi:hypothetical protein
MPSTRSVVLAAFLFAALSIPRLPPPASAAPRTEIPTFDPAHFQGDAIDNPYFPLRPGAVYEYEATTPDGAETSKFEVTFDAKSILGVPATVVRDRVWRGAVLIEDTFDWFAQDESGNVWYLGEDTKSYDDQGNFVGTEGSWEAGVAGAQPGVVMLAEPEKGASYAQEVAPGIAEDKARVTDGAAFAAVPYGSFSGVLETLEWSPLAPGDRERKLYARGVGLVLTEGKKERVELVRASGI